jgi:NADH-quinone oxidoreductase subunit N
MLAEIINLRKILIPAVILGLGAIFVVNMQLWGNTAPLTLGPVSLSHMITMDNFAVAFSGLAIVISMLIFILSASYYSNEENHLSDYLSILVFILCGALVMFSFANMAMLFLGIEILSISVYIMAGSRKFDTRSNEAGFKYFLMGAFASGFLLFGIALIYGATQSFELAKISAYVAAGNIHPMFYIGMMLMFMAMLFKVSAVPFHFWSPDVYEGAPALITALMSSLVKIAAFAAFYRLVSHAFIGSVYFAEEILVIVTIATMVIGNVIALNQQNVKRMLAYSGIAHAGYMMMAILGAKGQSDAALWYYSASYGLATVGLFAFAIMTFKSNFSENIEAFNGLAKKNPFVAACITILMLSTAGIPPFAGFMSKYFLFSETVRNGFITTTIVAVIASIISIYYYFKIILAMYTAAPNEKELNMHPAYYVVGIIGVLGVVILGVWPEPFMQLLK